MALLSKCNCTFRNCQLENPVLKNVAETEIGLAGSCTLSCSHNWTHHMSPLLHGIFWYFPCLYPPLYVRYYTRQSIIPHIWYFTWASFYPTNRITTIADRFAPGRYVALAAMPLSLEPVSMHFILVSGRFLPHLDQVEKILSAGNKRRVFQTLCSLRVCSVVSAASRRTLTGDRCPIQHPTCIYNRFLIL